MIYTVTLNPSIDYIVHVDDFKEGQLNKTKQTIKLPGGKGINVSRILNRLGTPSLALGFLGGFTGEFIQDWLTKEGIQTTFTQIADDTRINIKLKSQTETEINGNGPKLTSEEIQQFKEQLNQVTKGDIVVFSGSMPPSLPSHFYAELIQLVKEKQGEFVIDTTGDSLLQALKEKPLLVKPNHHELADMFQVTFSSLEDIFPYGKKLVEMGAQQALVSLGGEGALLFTATHIYYASAPKGILKNSVGAGDSMVAGFIHGLQQTNQPEEAFRYGVACGSATAFSDDLATYQAIQDVYDTVAIHCY
ncbi:1-phosphofructokinase [Vagococcus humatus]|uniref:Tagatose-6-phosphate kinase n=1 Tax=Vagococcus humatus TaxID=1889241 RepID=A0A3S0AEV9_9ENTE|nr:1-phosphofructokinase [Vagococcus humatus]RST90042.1 1-phosphofructokinase [Vagococcus humatus]